MTIHPQAISWLAASAANTLFKHSLHHPFPIYIHTKKEIMSIHEFPIHLRLKYVDGLVYYNLQKSILFRLQYLLITFSHMCILFWHNNPECISYIWLYIQFIA